MIAQANTQGRRNLIRYSCEGLVCFVVAGGFLWLAFDPGPFLRDVAEPITLISSQQRWESDFTWVSFAFRDRKGIERYAKYIYTGYIGVPIQNTLLLDDRQVPPQGREERGFLRLLQRWYQTDAEARDLTGRTANPDFSTLTEQQEAKFIAVRIMETLSKRN